MAPVIFENCNLEYSGEAMPFDNVDFRSCTFLFDINQEPPSNGKNLVNRLLAATDFKEVEFKVTPT